MRNTTLVTLTAIGFVSIVSSQAKAQTVANALQIGLGTDFVSYSNYTQRVTTPPIAAPGAPPPAGATVDYKNDIHQTRWGVSDHSNVNLEIGYGLNDNWVIGGLLVLGGWSDSQHEGILASPQNQQRSTFNLFIGPKVDYMFLPESRVRPFLGAAIGLSRTTYNLTNTNPLSVTTTGESWGYTGVGLFLRGGIRWFLTPGFSLDPAFVFGFSSMTGSAQGVPGRCGLDTANYDSGLTGFSVGLGVTASGWVGL